MATLCESLIASAIDFDCDDMVVKGLESDGIIINRSDIDMSSTVFDSSNPNIINTLVLESSKKGYAIQQNGKTPFTGTQTSMEEGTYRNTFTNTVSFVILNNGPEVAKNIIDGLANGSFVVILRNKHITEDSSSTAGTAEYQVYGYYQGLTASEISNDKYSEDTDGGWLVTLTETGVRKSAMFYFNTDSSTTATQYASLLTAAS